MKQHACTSRPWRLSGLISSSYSSSHALCTRRHPRINLCGAAQPYFFPNSAMVAARAKARSTVPIARPNTFPTARPTDFACRLELVERTFFAGDFRRTVVVDPVLAALAFTGVFFDFLSMTCAFGSISRCFTRFLVEGFFRRGCVFFARIFRIVPPG